VGKGLKSGRDVVRGWSLGPSHISRKKSNRNTGRVCITLKILGNLLGFYAMSSHTQKNYSSSLNTLKVTIPRTEVGYLILRLQYTFRSAIFFEYM